MFQSSSGLLAGCNPFEVAEVAAQFEFQSSSGLLAGCNKPPPAATAGRGQVSILIRPSGRMQLRSTPCTKCPTMFQSSSGLLAGCNLACAVVVACHNGFQSSSGLLAGCNWIVRYFISQFSHVSILIRPSGRMQRAALVFLGRPLIPVSILIRPSGRMQRPAAQPSLARSTEFQSSSGLLAGCNPLGTRFRWPTIPSFNPHPAFWPDATPKFYSSTVARLVSILIRPSGRMQPWE